MKKFYLVAIAALFVPFIASAAIATPASSGSAAPAISPNANFVSLIKPQQPNNPGFVWGFYPSGQPNPYVITFNCSCGWSPVHDMTVDTFNAGTGAFTASGTQVGYPSITWNAVGTTTIDSNATGTINFQITYTGSYAGYTVSASGTIATDGSLSGTAYSPLDGNTYTWTMNRKAKPVGTVEDGTSCSQFNGWLNAPTIATSLVTTTKLTAVDIRTDGSVWANDNFAWSLKVLQIATSSEGGQNLYCGIVHYTGLYTTPTGTEVGPDNAVYPSSTINGSVSGNFIGSEAVSFTANGAPSAGLSNTTDWYNWMNDYFSGVSNITDNQVWAYVRNNDGQQWVENYTNNGTPTGWANYGNITNP